MQQTGEITSENYEKARQSELKIIPLRVDDTEAPYLVDFIHEELLKDFSEDELINSGFSVEKPEILAPPGFPFQVSVGHCHRGEVRRGIDGRLLVVDARNIQHSH